MIETTVGDRLRQLRKASQMTQEDLALKLGVSRVQVNQWECGAREISAERIAVLSEVFQVSCDYLLKGEDHKFTESGENRIIITDRKDDLTALLSDSTQAALRDLAHSPHKELYSKILNGLIGSRRFWLTIMPASASAFQEIEKASEAFSELLTAIITKDALEKAKEAADSTASYHANDMNKSEN